jgi:predicted NBD/HSP70 family sugar kinase
MSSAPGSTASLRTANQRRVLAVLRGRPLELPEASPDHDADSFTQAELARATGLAPATISNIVRDLGAAGLLESDPGSGRRGSSVRIGPGAGHVLGIDFGHSHVAVALADTAGRPLGESRSRMAAGLDHASALDQAHRMAIELADELGLPHPEGRLPESLHHAGLGLPAPVTDDTISSSEIFPGWEGVDARRAAEQHLGVPVSIENDANLGALAEHRRGVARGHRTSVFIKISSGAGAGIIIDGEVFRGARGTAGEIGHLTLDEQGPVCRCGSRGCLEAYTSVETVQSLMAAQLPEATLDDIIEAATSGSVAARRVFEDSGLHLGWGLASIVNLINPDVVVVGGDMARAGELLLESARLGLRRHALSAVAQTPVLASELGERASLLGAALLAADRTELVGEGSVAAHGSPRGA